MNWLKRTRISRARKVRRIGYYYPTLQKELKRLKSRYIVIFSAKASHTVYFDGHGNISPAFIYFLKIRTNSKKSTRVSFIYHHIYFGNVTNEYLFHQILLYCITHCIV